MEKKTKVIINSYSQSQESYSVGPEMKATTCTENVFSGDDFLILDHGSLADETKKSSTTPAE